MRPRTCISRNPEDIKQFVAEQDGQAVIKPLQGSGGASVFLVREDDGANMNQMIDAVMRDGYCIAQEYLPAAQEGDVRLFVMNGRPLQKEGKYAAFRRVNKTGDMRSNMHSGGESEAVPRSTAPRCGWSSSSGPNSSPTACSWSGSTSSKTSSWRSTCSRPAAWAARSQPPASTLRRS